MGHGVMLTVAEPKALGVENPEGWTRETVVVPVFKKATVSVVPMDPGCTVIVGNVDPTVGVLFRTETVSGWPPAKAWTRDGKPSSSSAAGNTLNGALPCARVLEVNGG